MLNEVADGGWVRQSACAWSDDIAVRGEGGWILVHPGIDGSDLYQLADDLDRVGIRVVAAFSTIPTGPASAVSGGTAAAAAAARRGLTSRSPQ